jgi:hypothetical protein
MKGENLDNLLDDVKYDIQKSSTRVRNKAFYDPAYRPVPRELRELDELAHILNVSVSHIEAKEPISKCLRPSTTDVKCVCLKQEPVILKKIKPNDNGVVIGGLRELVLLSHGVIVSSADFYSRKRTLFRSMGQKKSYDYCSDVNSITSVMDDGGAKFSIKGPFDIVLQFECSSNERKEAWLDALATCIIENRKLDKQTRKIGWEHEIMQTSIHSCAVCNDINKLKQMLDNSCDKTKEIDELDVYNGLSALHLSIIYDNLNFAKELLRASADPNISTESFENGDKEGPDLLESFYVATTDLIKGISDPDFASAITPMTYGKNCKGDNFILLSSLICMSHGDEALQSNNDAAIDLLESFGATKSGCASSPGKSVEIGCQDQVTEFSDGLASVEHALKSFIFGDGSEAEVPNTKINENLVIMEERKSRLESLSLESSNLRDEAATYKRMTSQLRDKMEKQSKWF